MPSGPAPNYTDDEIVAALENRNSSWEWLISKAGINIDSPAEKVGGTVYIRMKRDSVIWIMVKKYGVEAVRAQMTPDSFQIIYRLERVYDEGRLSSLLAHYNLDFTFEDMQQMIYGNVMLPDTASISVIQGDALHRILGISGNLDLHYTLDPYELLLQSLFIRDSSQREVFIRYDDYEDLGEYGYIAQNRLYTLPYNATETASLRLEFKDFDINKPRPIKFSIPSYYERL